jgi:arylsulfatase A-like enzyme
MKHAWLRTLKALGIVSLLAVLGYIAFPFIRAEYAERLVAKMRIDAHRNPLVVFVLIDTLRRDHVATLGYDRATTPNLDRLASEGFVASGMLAHSSQTVPSVSSMFTSKAPHAHGVQFDLRTDGFGNQGESKTPLLAEDNLTLAEVLSGEGYFTAGAIANPWLRKEFGFAQGFDQYGVTAFFKDKPGVDDGAGINEAASKVIHEHAAEKTFLYLHYMDVHNPYAHNGQLPEVFRKGPGSVRYTNGPIEGVSAKDLAYSIGAYDDGVLYMDSLIGELVRELETATAERDVLLVITSDHGDEFLEHGGMGHGSTLYPELIESFAIFWRPESRMRHPRDEQLSGTIDIAPTLLDLLGVPQPKEMVGRSLLGSASGGTVISELAGKKAAIKKHWGLIRDLETQKDEVVAYSGARESERTPALVAELRSLLDSLEFRQMPASDAVIDAKFEKQLKALGYIE